jgi:hypothetical protein
MMIKQFARVATLLSLSTLGSLVAIAPASFANPAVGEQAGQLPPDQSPTLRQGIPGRRVGGGTRGDFIFANASGSLTALTAQSPLTITTASHPKLLFYVPEMLSDNKVEFVLRDRQDTLIYETTLSLSHEAGIVSVDLAESGLSALNLNEDYQWYFSIVPDAQDRANDVVVHGSIRYVDAAEWLAQQPAGAELSAQLATAEPLEKARLLYQQANLWQDAALLLDSLYQADPENVVIAAEWNQLLQSAGLLNIVPTTIMPRSSSPVQIVLYPDLQAFLLENSHRV